MVTDRDGHAGFTLLEVLVAVAVIGFAFTGLLALHNRNIGLVGRGQDLTRATLLLRELVAQVELLPEFSEFGPGSGVCDGHPGFRWEREVSATEMDELRQVRLRVIFDERNPRAAEVVYYVHRPPT